MAIYFDKWYRDFGIRFSSHLSNPPIHNANELEFPKESVVHWGPISETPVYPTSKTNIFQHTPEDVLVESILEYKNPNHTIGKFVNAAVTLQELIRDISTQDDKFMYLKHNQFIRKGPNALYIENYGSLTARYKYRTNPMERYWIYFNAISCMLDNLDALPDRNKFLVLELPNVLPSKMDLNNAAKELKLAFLNKLPSYKHFTVLELWKLFTPMYREESVFSNISMETAKKLTVIFLIDDRYFAINFYNLVSIVKEYELETDFMQYKSELAKKLLYTLFLKLSINPNLQKIVKLKVNMDNIKNEDKTKKELDKEEDEKLFNATLDETLEGSNYGDTSEESKDVDIDEVSESEVVDDGLTKTIESLNNSLDGHNDVGSLEEIFNNTLSYDGVESKIDALKENKVINKKQHDHLKEILDNQKLDTDLWCDKLKLGEILDDTKDNYDVKTNLSNVTPNPVLPNEEDNQVTTQAIQKDYLDNQYKKDVVRTLYSLQNTSTIITNHSVELKESVAGKLEEHTLDLKTLNGGNSTIKVILPVIDKDGSFEYSGSKYRMRTQRTDKIIRKISRDMVSLSTHYGRLFIQKAYHSSNNVGKFLIKTLANHPDVSSLILGEVDTQDLELPQLYNYLSRGIKSFKFKNFDFFLEYPKRFTLYSGLSEEEADKLDKKFIEDGLTIFGTHRGNYLLLDNDNRVFEYKNDEYQELDDFYTLLGIDRSNEPVEFAMIKILGTNIPIGVVLCYYIGFSNLLSLFELNYQVHPVKARVEVKPNQYVIKFQEVKYIIDRDYGKADLILGGIADLDKITRSIDPGVLDSRSLYNIIFSKLEFNLNMLTEIKTIETMFLDPISITILKKLKEPTNVKGLMIKACELLETDNYTNPNDVKGSLFKGYERVPGILYRELVSAIKQHENRSNFSRSKITLNPYIVLNKIQEDSSTVAVDNLNPMASIKQAEDTTFLGIGGRSKIGMSVDTRSIDPTEIGVVSEAVKDNGDVGITSLLSADPKLNSTRGTVGDINIDNGGWNNILSSCSMINPFILHDDGKRMNFSTIMQSHIVPLDKMRVPYILTGYETVIPIKAGDKFVISALDDGVVKSVSKDKVVVKYKTLGEKEHTFHNWTSKEESGTCYTHILVPNVKPGDTVVKDDSLVYDKSFFSPCVFYPKRVLYKQGQMLTVALMENVETYEDSGSISAKAGGLLSTTVTKVISDVISVEDNIGDIMEVGAKVNPSSVLYVVYNKMLDEDSMDADSLQLLKTLNSRAAKAKLNGVITKIEIRYNAEKSEMSPSVSKFVTSVDKSMKATKGYDGKVDESYSVRGKPLRKGFLQIKYYIDASAGMGIGDKAILANQLKFTVGEVFHNKVTAQDNTEVDMFFASRSISARIVCSPNLMGTTGMLLEKLTDKAVEMYFN